MAVVLSCRCGKTFRSRDEHAGKRATCPNCGAVLTIPAPPSADIQTPAKSSPGVPRTVQCADCGGTLAAYEVVNDGPRVVCNACNRAGSESSRTKLVLAVTGSVILVAVAATFWAVLTPKEIQTAEDLGAVNAVAVPTRSDPASPPNTDGAAKDRDAVNAVAVSKRSAPVETANTGRTAKDLDAVSSTRRPPRPVGPNGPRWAPPTRSAPAAAANTGRAVQQQPIHKPPDNQAIAQAPGGSRAGASNAERGGVPSERQETRPGSKTTGLENPVLVEPDLAVDDANGAEQLRKIDEYEAILAMLGRLFEETATKSRRELLRLARDGDVPAQVELAQMVYAGHGGRQNAKEALWWFRKAAEQGNATAQVRLGEMYEKGEGTRRSYSTALKWYRRAVSNGSTQGQVRLGEMYVLGRGMKNNDFDKAYELFQDAADHHDAAAQFSIGKMHAGGMGRPRDLRVAAQWARKAAANGHVPAQTALGISYQQGWGVKRDYEEAMKWYRLAAAQGDTDAQNNLGVMYRTGQGVEPDREEALRWYYRAAEQGNALAKRNIEELEGNAEWMRREFLAAILMEILSAPMGGNPPSQSSYHMREAEKWGSHYLNR